MKRYMENTDGFSFSFEVGVELLSFFGFFFGGIWD